MKASRGFTLIELLVVFAIMGVMVSVAPSAYEKLREGVQYRDTLRAMISDMREARAKATFQGREARFVVNLSSRTFGVDGGALKSFPPGVQIQATVANKETRPNGSVSILFLPKGGATGGNFVLSRAGGGGVRLKVDWLSGQVTQEPL